MSNKGITPEKKIYIAGHRGLVGSAIWRNLEARGYHNLVGRSHAQLDLLDPAAVARFFSQEKPDAVVLAAAHVGGIMANNTYRADFIYQNLQIQQNVIGEAWRSGVQHLLFLGSTCIYPRQAPQPMTEDCLLTSELEYTNEPYAIAKIAGMKLCESLNLQYGTDYIAVMPTNLYGINDNFDLVRGHVLPSMMRKMHLAKLVAEGKYEAVRADLRQRPQQGINPEVSDAELLNTLQNIGISPDGSLALWGSGKPMREFLWSDDMADASVHILLNVSFSDMLKLCNDGDVRNTHINIGTGKEVSIAQLADILAQTVGYQGNITWDNTKPDGTMRKLCDVSRLHSLGWEHSVELSDGCRLLYQAYLGNNTSTR